MSSVLYFFRSDLYYNAPGFEDFRAALTKRKVPAVLFWGFGPAPWPPPELLGSNRFISKHDEFE